MELQDHIRIIPDFPKKGINFYDIATLLAHPHAWKHTIESLKEIVAPYQPDFILGIESRGFLVAAPLALNMECGFGMVRKKGKLPGDTLSYAYDLEYGSDEIELQPDIIPDGAKVALVDDLLATGGTMAAAEHLIHKAGADVVINAAIIELDGLSGAKKLKNPFVPLLNCPA